jgi:peroxiredoxin
MRRRKWLQIIIFTAVIAVGALTIGGQLFSKEEVPKEGNKAPDFSLSGMDGKIYNLSDYSNNVVILNFWGTFCPPCRNEMPAIEAQYNKWKDKGLVVLGINLGEAEVTVQGFVNQYGLTFPILYDPNLQIRDRYRVTQYPTTFFIKKGKIEIVQIGQMQESFLENAIQSLMTE